MAVLFTYLLYPFFSMLPTNFIDFSPFLYTKTKGHMSHFITLVFWMGFSDEEYIFLGNFEDVSYKN